MATSTIITDFGSVIDSIATKVTGANSIYDKTLTKLIEIYAASGMSADDQNKIIAEVSAQLSISTTNAAISAAADIAKNSPIIDAQVLTEGSKRGLVDNQAATELKKALDVVSSTAVRDAQSAQDLVNKAAEKLLTDAKKSLIEKQALTEVARELMTDRQTEAFNDKLLVEVGKFMSGVGQMEATTGTTQADTLLAINKSLNLMFEAAGVTTLATNKIYNEA